MSTQSSGRKTPVDHGVQIRFINNLHGSGCAPGTQPRAKPQPHSKYGVAVRVQGIAGQPYVLLKDGGEKGDSYGVQLRTNPPPAYGSLPRRREWEEQAGQEGETDGGGGQAGGLRRAQSHGSLLERDDGGGGRGSAGGDFQLGRPPGDGRSGSYGNLDGGIGIRAEREPAGGAREGDPQRNAWRGSHDVGLNGTLGRERASQSYPEPPALSEEPPAGHRNSPVNRLVNRFQQRGRSPAPEDQAFSGNPYSSPPSSAHSSLGRGQGATPEPAPLPAQQWASPGRYVSKETVSANTTTEIQVTPDLLLDQGQSSEVTSEEEQMKQTIYTVLREGTRESDAVVKNKVSFIFQKLQTLKGREGSSEEWLREKRVLERRLSELQAALQTERARGGSAGNSDLALKAELECSLDDNLQLQDILDRKKAELHQTHSELTQLRMERENAETRVREVEDLLAELQEQLRREDGTKTELLSCRAELAEARQQRQRLEESLRQRERELTALKGALKDEVATHDREIEALREQYSTDMEKLRSSMEEVSQSQAGIEAERLRVNSSVRTLQQQLEDCRDESGHWMEQFHSTRDELRTTKQQLLQARLDKEEFEEELKEAQDRVASMKQQIPDPSHTETLNKDLQDCRADLKKAQSEVEKHRAEHDRRVMEVISLKKAHQEQEADLKYETDRLKEQLQRAKGEVAKAQEKNKKLPDPAVVSELEEKLAEARAEAEQLRDKLSLAEQDLDASRTRMGRTQTELNALQDAQLEQEEANTRLREKLSRLEAQLLSSTKQSSEAELALHDQVRGLRAELDEARRGATRLGQEHRELSLHLEEKAKDRESLTQANTQLEEVRRQQERALEKINKEYEILSTSSRAEIQALKTQLEEQRERVRRESQEAQRHGNEAQAELERSQMSMRRLEEEVSRQKKEILAMGEERDNVRLDKELLTNRLRHLEGELEESKSTFGDKAREVRSLEDKLKRAELELEEERAGVELLTERVTRSRDQIDQLRSELLQERSSKQDLELDKNALERQMKELRGRVADMEGQSRSSTGVSQLESKVQELEERLRTEEREKNSMVTSQRRLERKLKELTMTLDEERHQQTEQRDQLLLRVKALKRQVDEGETEVERVETLRRKAQREMEEQVELKEALQGRVTALETELKRKTQAARRPALDSSALSSDEDDDDDSLYDPASITSILTEGNLQTSSC